jgi:hemerythrin
MLLVEWSETLSTGVSKIDDEHKQIVGMLNELYGALQAKRSEEALGKVLDGLVAYTARHFKHEESLFAQTGYPGAAEHKNEHDELTNRVLLMQKDYCEGKSATLPVELLNMLRKWLLTHILISDKKFGPHLNACGIR